MCAFVYSSSSFLIWLVLQRCENGQSSKHAQSPSLHVPHIPTSTFIANLQLYCQQWRWCSFRDKMGTVGLKSESKFWTTCTDLSLTDSPFTLKSMIRSKMDMDSRYTSRSVQSTYVFHTCAVEALTYSPCIHKCCTDIHTWVHAYPCQHKQILVAMQMWKV